VVRSFHFLSVVFCDVVFESPFHPPVTALLSSLEFLACICLIFSLVLCAVISFLAPGSQIEFAL
jgi:hypothetical protein